MLFIPSWLQTPPPSSETIIRNLRTNQGLNIPTPLLVYAPGTSWEVWFYYDDKRGRFVSCSQGQRDLEANNIFLKILVNLFS